MHKNYIRFVRDQHGNGIGAVAITFDNGLFGIGTSMCHPEDKFDKKLGREKAISRSEENLDITFIDLINSSWADEILSALPRAEKRRDDVESVLSTIIDMIEQDVVVDLARMYVKIFQN